MAKLKALIFAGGALAGLSGGAFAADLLPPPPAIEPAPVAVAAPASEFGGGWYLRGDIGLGMSANTPSFQTTPNPLAGLPADAYETFNNPSMSSFGLFDVGVGYQINDWLRADITGEYRGGAHAQVLDLVGIPSANSQFADFYRGDVSAFVGLVNGYVDVGTWYGVTPYIGAGAGVARNTFSGITDNGIACGGAGCSPAGGFLANGTQTNFAWALMAGLGFNVTQNLKLDLGYRYLNMGKIGSGISNCLNGTGAGSGFSTAQCSGGGYKVATTNTLATNDFRIGLRWMLNDSTPTYAPVSAPGPLVRKY